MNNSLLRKLPGVDELLKSRELVEFASALSHSRMVDLIRQSIDDFRHQIQTGSLDTKFEHGSSLKQAVVQCICERVLVDDQLRLQSIINATGVILHTNLGRAPLAQLAMQRANETAGYTNLELSLASGKRSQRGERVTDLIRALSGAEDAIVVNNCAAATVLTLQAVAQKREVIVARSQLVEIGGGFRLPEVFETAGVRLKEIGTTNRTYVADYERAISEQTGAIIRVHRSNFALTGFVSEPDIGDLVSCRRPPGIPVIDDLGSGWISSSLPPEAAALQHASIREPCVRASVADGADLSLFSGDKLLGGPQCGIVVGKQNWIEKLKKHPLMRAFRVGKLTMAALEATIELHLSDDAFRQIPVLRMLHTPASELEERCHQIVAGLAISNSVCWEVVACESRVGGGSMPHEGLPSYGIRMEVDRPQLAASLLRSTDPPILGRLTRDQLIFDVRTVLPEQYSEFTRCLNEIVDQISRSGGC